jgi:hypothetical protein
MDGDGIEFEQEAVIGIDEDVDAEVPWDVSPMRNRG